MQTSLQKMLNTAGNLMLWMPLIPARFRHFMPLWAPLIDHLLCTLLPDQVCGLSHAPLPYTAADGAMQHAIAFFSVSCKDARAFPHHDHPMPQYRFLLCNLQLLYGHDLTPTQHSTCSAVQNEAQHGLLLPDLAAALAAAVHAKQVPVQDLLGCQQFATSAKQASSGKGRPGVGKAFARLTLQAFVDAEGACHLLHCAEVSSHKWQAGGCLACLHEP